MYYKMENTPTINPDQLEAEGKLIFSNWKASPHALGKIMTNLPEIRKDTPQDIVDYELLSTIKKTGKNPNTNRTNKWDDDKEKKLSFLDRIINNKPVVDVLPTGAITYLDEVFRDKFWGRKRIVINKYTDKGLRVEQDVLDLASEIDNTYYDKNEEQLENEYLIGTPDNRQDNKERDAKANYDMESFDKAELTSLYDWQIKGYCFIDNVTEGELIYGLVNTPLHRLESEKKTLWYSLGMPDETEEWLELCKQIERNMIFDPIKFKEEYPNYIFLNDMDILHVPPICRIKKFYVTLSKTDKIHIIRRVELARKYLIKKEKIEIKKSLTPLNNLLKG